MYDKTLKVLKTAYKKQTKKVTKTAKKVLEVQKRAMNRAVASNLKTAKSTKKKISNVTKRATQRLISQVQRKKDTPPKIINRSEATKGLKKYPKDLKLSKEFIMAVIQPLKAANSKKMPLEDSWLKVIKDFKVLSNASSSVPPKEAVKETKTALVNLNKVLKKHFSSGRPYFDHMKLTMVNQSFDALKNQMDISYSILDRWDRSSRVSIVSRSKSPAVSPALIGALIRYWVKITDSKAIIASTGSHPGGIFLQRVLKTYFKVELTTTQLQKLLDTTYASFGAQVAVKKKQVEMMKKRAITDHQKRDSWLKNIKLKN